MDSAAVGEDPEEFARKAAREREAAAERARKVAAEEFLCRKVRDPRPASASADRAREAAVEEFVRRGWTPSTKHVGLQQAQDAVHRAVTAWVEKLRSHKKKVHYEQHMFSRALVLSPSEWAWHRFVIETLGNVALSAPPGTIFSGVPVKTGDRKDAISRFLEFSGRCQLYLLGGVSNPASSSVSNNRQCTALIVARGRKEDTWPSKEGFIYTPELLTDEELSQEVHSLVKAMETPEDVEKKDKTQPVKVYAETADGHIQYCGPHVVVQYGPSSVGDAGLAVRFTLRPVSLAQFNAPPDPDAATRSWKLGLRICEKAVSERRQDGTCMDVGLSHSLSAVAAAVRHYCRRNGTVTLRRIPSGTTPGVSLRIAENNNRDPKEWLSCGNWEAVVSAEPTVAELCRDMSVGREAHRVGASSAPVARRVNSVLSYLPGIVQRTEGDRAPGCPLPICAPPAEAGLTRHVEFYEEKGLGIGVRLNDPRIVKKGDLIGVYSGVIVPKCAVDIESAIEMNQKRWNYVLNCGKGQPCIDGGLFGNWSSRANHDDVQPTMVCRKLSYRTEVDDPWGIDPFASAMRGECCTASATKGRRAAWLWPDAQKKGDGGRVVGVTAFYAAADLPNGTPLTWDYGCGDDYWTQQGVVKKQHPKAWAVDFGGNAAAAAAAEPPAKKKRRVSAAAAAPPPLTPGTVTAEEDAWQQRSAWLFAGGGDILVRNALSEPERSFELDVVDDWTPVRYHRAQPPGKPPLPNGLWCVPRKEFDDRVENWHNVMAGRTPLRKLRPAEVAENVFIACGEHGGEWAPWLLYVTRVNEKKKTVHGVLLELPSPVDDGTGQRRSQSWVNHWGFAAHPGGDLRLSTALAAATSYPVKSIALRDLPVRECSGHLRVAAKDWAETLRAFDEFQQRQQWEKDGAKPVEVRGWEKSEYVVLVGESSTKPVCYAPWVARVVKMEDRSFRARVVELLVEG